MLDAGRLLTAPGSLRAEVAEPGSYRNKIDVDFIRTGGNEFVNPDADHASGKVMLLLAGDLAGMAAGAPIVLNK
jgi:hypothetical protein